MSLRIESRSDLRAYSQLSIAFEVRSELLPEPTDAGLGGIALRERAVSPAWRKDYDAHDGGPLAWPLRFDVRRWGVLVAREREQLLGGAVIIAMDPSLDLLRAREDTALLWDLRVAPSQRGRGVGKALFAAAEGWARARGAHRLRVETQSINVPACRFYVRMGCTLRAFDRDAYPAFPREVQLLWGKSITAPGADSGG